MIPAVGVAVSALAPRGALRSPTAGRGLVLPGPISYSAALATRPGSRAGEAASLRARIRQASEQQCRDALLWLSGYTPHGTDLALLAAMTPLGSLATGGAR